MIVHVAGGLTVHCVVLGGFETNCYVLVCGSAASARGTGCKPAPPEVCWVVDPARDADTLLKLLGEKELVPQRVLLTHGHGDHIGGVGAVKKVYPSAILTAPAGDLKMLSSPVTNLSLLFFQRITTPAPEQVIAAGEEIPMGPLSWQVLDTAGHTPGGVSYYCRSANVALTGDSLFAGSIGRIDLPGSSAERLVSNIRQRLLTLPEDTVVLPGHGPATTIGQERRSNPFVGEGAEP